MSAVQQSIPAAGIPVGLADPVCDADDDDFDEAEYEQWLRDNPPVLIEDDYQVFAP